LQKQRLVTLEKDELDAIYKKMFDLKKSVNELNNAMKKSPLRLSTNETNQVSTDQQARE
jgi:uncharacterized protein YoxC